MPTGRPDIGQDGQPAQVVPLGVVVRRTPGVTRWAAWSWQAVGVLPGAGPADWQVLRREETPRGTVTDYHAATLPLELWPPEAAAYRAMLGSRRPGIGVVMRDVPGAGAATDARPRVVLVTASPFEAQDYLDSGDEVVELVAMPDALGALIDAFVARHHVEVPFVKRRRDRQDTDAVEDGIGDARIRQTADVYRAPRGGGR